jgi:hypothetical protein
MPVHIGELNAKVTVVDGDLPLTPRQVENLVCLVMARLDEQTRTDARQKSDQQLRTTVIPDSGIHE